jgi:xylulokinase
VLEGVAFSARHLLGECEKAAGIPVREVRLSGGGARSATWNAIKASTHGRPLRRLETLDTGVLGAALMGMVAAGIEDDLAAVAERHAAVAAEIEPEPAEMPRLDDLYDVYRATYEALAPVFPRLAVRGRGAAG